MKIIHSIERASEAGRPDWFTGTVWLDEIAEDYRFSPRAAGDEK